MPLFWGSELLLQDTLFLICCLLSRFHDLNALLFVASWKMRNFILMMKTPGETHSFVECFRSDQLYECVRSNTDGRLPWLIFFFYVYLYIFIIFKNIYLGGILSGGYNLDWDFQFKKGAVILSFVRLGFIRAVLVQPCGRCRAIPLFSLTGLGDFLLYHLWRSCANEKGNLVYYMEQLASILIRCGVCHL